MKRITAFIILTGILAACCIYSGLGTGITVSAAGELDISVSAASGRPGDTVKLDLNISNNAGFSFLKLTVGYDSKNLTLVSVENSGILKNISYEGPENIKNNPFSMVWLSSSNVTSSGKAAVLTFKINSNAGSGSTAIKLTCSECFDQNTDTVKASVTNGAVTISNTAAPTETQAGLTASPSATAPTTGTASPTNTAAATQTPDTPQSASPSASSPDTPDVTNSSGIQSGSTASPAPSANSGNGENEGSTLWPLWFLLLIPVAGVIVYIVIRKKSKKK